MSGVPEPFAPVHDADPYPLLAGLREAGPIHLCRMPDGQRVWLVVRHAEARQVLLDPRMSKDPRNARPEWQAANRGNPLADRSVLGPNLGVVDPPDHTRLRRLVSRAFGPARVEGLRSHVRDLVDDLVDGLTGRARADLVAAFAEPLPSIVICRLLGVPAGDRRGFRGWVRDIVSAEPGADQGVLAERRHDASLRLGSYLGKLTEAKRADPGDDLISDLLKAHDDGDRLTADELQSMLFVLLIGGYETTLNLISSGVLRLCEAGLWRAVGASPELAGPAVEELLRFDNSVKTTFWRFPKVDVAVGDVVVGAGEPLMVSLAAVNRDPAANAVPDRFVLHRADRRHLGFGLGPHYCVGAPLARLEAEVALEALTRRCPELRVTAAPEILAWHHSPIIRGVRELPISPGRVRARASRAGELSDASATGPKTDG
ncbi:cytochrome P450 [Actinomadura chokoriensis]|uniref:Cytochrome P450 n=1 Tax=Actinomadura chokoriensis TaxID=454156 RepID=A0ABV4R2K5_9ACTN